MTNEPISVLILCGGRGTRIRDVAGNVPKPLVEIGGRPILWHIIKLYSHFGFKAFILCLGYKGNLIKDYFLKYEAMNNDFTICPGRSDQIWYHGNHGESDLQVTLADTGLDTQTGARVYRAAKRYASSQRIMVTYGDGVSDIDIRALVEFHLDHGKLATITGVRPPGRFGEMALEGNCAVEFKEKPQTSGGRINGGFMVFEPGFVERYLSDDGGLILERQPLQQAAADRELMCFCHDGFWQPMDTYREWERLNQMWNAGNAPWRLWGG